MGGPAPEAACECASVIPEPVDQKDFTDDRLADLLRWLAEDEVWASIEREIGCRLVEVYELERALVRLDSTSVSVHHDAEEGTLFGYGHSKDHRPDLAQFKLMLASLDPLGLPVATLVVPGEQADDPLYMPAIQAARPEVGQGGLLYVGDTKMSALSTRAFVALGGDYYLTPLPLTGEVPALLRQLVAGADEQVLTGVEAAPDTPDEAPRLGARRHAGDRGSWLRSPCGAAPNGSVGRSLRWVHFILRPCRTRWPGARNACRMHCASGPPVIYSKLLGRCWRGRTEGELQETGKR